MRTREEYKEISRIAIERIKKLATYCNCFREWLHVRSSNDEIEDHNLLWMVEKEFSRYRHDTDELVSIYSGYNKTTLVFDDDIEPFGEEWVIKFPKNVTPKEQLKDGRWTACDREAEYYAYAEEEGLAQYFAECWNDSLELDGEEIPFYVMQRADPNEDEVYYLSDMGEDYTGCEDAVWEAFSNMYGTTEANRLSSFCKRFEINDLHEGNVGFIDGNLVCIDYSGYISGEEDNEW